jgi:hypothetical protein
MSKYLLLAVSAGVLSACTLTINGSGSEGNTTPQQTSQTSEDPSDPSGLTTDAPTSEPVGTTTETVPTTGTPTTGGESTGPVASDTTVGDSTEGPVLTGTGTGTDSEGSSGTDTGGSDTTDTGGSEYGQCGWNAGQTYYACPDDGGVPGLSDPKKNYPIDCRDQELAAGAACGAVGPAGCCTAEGNLYYCADSILVEQKCGA